jgi:hypothetical protein
MIEDEDLVSLAGQSPFIFGGEILSEDSSAVVVVDEVIRVPEGLTGLAGSHVTVHLTHPLKRGRYIFFADPFAVGTSVSVRERAHLEGDSPESSERVLAAMRESYARLIDGRFEPAALVVLGTLGDVRALTEGRPRGIPWAEAPLKIERTLKGPAKLHHAVVLGPRYGSRKIPAAPPLRPGLHAIFFLTHAPHEAVELSGESRDVAFHIATSWDIQPPERLTEIEHIAAKERK